MASKTFPVNLRRLLFGALAIGVLLPHVLAYVPGQKHGWQPSKTSALADRRDSSPARRCPIWLYSRHALHPSATREGLWREYPYPYSGKRGKRQGTFSAMDSPP